MRTRWDIEVPDEIVDRAIQRDSSHCVLADAIRAAIPGASRISVDLQTIRITLDGQRFVWLTPRAAQEAIVDYDQGIRPTIKRFRLKSPQVTSSKSPERATIIRGTGTGGSGEKRTGGRTPPKSGYGTLREFGLRGLRR
jgi:hypothetical protein